MIINLHHFVPITFYSLYFIIQCVFLLIRVATMLFQTCWKTLFVYCIKKSCSRRITFCYWGNNIFEKKRILLFTVDEIIRKLTSRFDWHFFISYIFFYISFIKSMTAAVVYDVWIANLKVNFVKFSLNERMYLVSLMVNLQNSTMNCKKLTIMV